MYRLQYNQIYKVKQELGVHAMDPPARNILRKDSMPIRESQKHDFEP